MRIPPRSQLALDFIRDFHARHHMAPSLAEIAADLETSIETARGAVAKLEELGIVSRTPRGPRTIRIVNDPKPKEA